LLSFAQTYFGWPFNLLLSFAMQSNLPKITLRKKHQLSRKVRIDFGLEQLNMNLSRFSFPIPNQIWIPKEPKGRAEFMPPIEPGEKNPRYCCLICWDKGLPFEKCVGAIAHRNKHTSGAFPGHEAIFTFKNTPRLTNVCADLPSLGFLPVTSQEHPEEVAVKAEILAFRLHSQSMFPNITASLPEVPEVGVQMGAFPKHLLVRTKAPPELPLNSPSCGVGDGVPGFLNLPGKRIFVGRGHPRLSEKEAFREP
jgi:hypothetical protein